ncbi:hypothetical protein [Chryseobacterium potabilaquae]|uniref:Nuclear transport factor 2 family protein n=1 Tax=Chryseobacterium potabilaquae TaxID=2675057 RepID=A0A6N4WZ29_9FLAO|nr:hypothetical protein [Chryseobacterium potabilaquae]CAA7193718.1 hypothetical protein CHRY9293_00130 [Chryseobacterium potabilaquae]
MEKIVIGMLKDIIENPHYDEKLIHQYFANEYKQTVDHITLDLDQFKKHIQKLKGLSQSAQIDILNCVSGNETVFTKHKVCSTLKDGSIHTHKVLAEFKISNGKIINCEELTFLMEGSDTGKHLGSVF